MGVDTGFGFGAGMAAFGLVTGVAFGFGADFMIGFGVGLLVGLGGVIIFCDFFYVVNTDFAGVYGADPDFPFIAFLIAFYVSSYMEGFFNAELIYGFTADFLTGGIDFFGAGIEVVFFYATGFLIGGAGILAGFTGSCDN